MKHAALQAATRSSVHPTAIMRMRWVVTRKSESSLKARLVVLRFAFPESGAKPTTSPTVSRRGRQLFLTVARTQGMRVFKADAKTAFLQGSVGDQELLCEPVSELSQALGLEHQQCVQPRKTVCGLTDAPHAWWERVKKRHNKSGMENLDNRIVLLELPTARRDNVGLLGQLKWLATQVIPQVSAPWPQCFKQTNLLDVRWFGLRHRC